MRWARGEPDVERGGPVPQHLHRVSVGARARVRVWVWVRVRVRVRVLKVRVWRVGSSAPSRRT